MNTDMTIYEILRMPFDSGPITGITTYHDDVLITTEDKVYCLKYCPESMEYDLYLASPDQPPAERV